MFKKLIPHPILSVMLIIIWLLLNNDFSVGQMVLGAILGVVIPIITTGFWPDQVDAQKPWLWVKFFGVVIYDIIAANILVARWILGRSQTLRPAFMELTIELTSPLAISILASTISLTPGTVSCSLSADKRRLLIHSLHVENISIALVQMHERYQKPLLEMIK
ncbi:Na+/H+ antiporter subunit E [Thiofilum flexile]|uniref:Na+/H+ antiporter subunit E n=1 Tax=Thiofilum flexile TaxID=125627 RepID=UPI00035D0365|nr:Na+/H+ antiporter subunit E [Thiofilum flexile]